MINFVAQMKTVRLTGISLFILWIYAPLLFSQSIVNKGDILESLKGSGEYNSEFSIELDSMIENNYYKHILYNQKNEAVMGWRIRIFSGSGHDAFQKANETRARFLSKYEDIDAYISYVAPDYKVYVGDCRTRSEVLKLFQRINKDFPYAFLVPHSINVDKEK